MDLHHHSAGQQPSDSRYTKVATATDAQLLLLLLDDQPGMLGASSLYLCPATGPAANTTDCTCWNTDRAVAQHAANPASTTATRSVVDAVDQLPPLPSLYLPPNRTRSKTVAALWGLAFHAMRMTPVCPRRHPATSRRGVVCCGVAQTESRVRLASPQLLPSWWASPAAAAEEAPEVAWQRHGPTLGAHHLSLSWS